MGQNFPCGICRNFEEEHRACLATVLLKVAIFFGIYFLSNLYVCFLTISQMQVVPDLLRAFCNIQSIA